MCASRSVLVCERVRGAFVCRRAAISVRLGEGRKREGGRAAWGWRQRERERESKYPGRGEGTAVLSWDPCRCFLHEHTPSHQLVPRLRGTMYGDDGHFNLISHTVPCQSTVNERARARARTHTHTQSDGERRVGRRRDYQVCAHRLVLLLLVGAPPIPYTHTPQYPLCREELNWERGVCVGGA
eukprot:545187-Rhodomonas_salina.2